MIAMDEWSIMKVIISLCYITSTLLQILVPAYFGNEIQVNSAAAFNAIYHSDWINADKEYKKLCLIAMENMKKPIKLRAYSIFQIDLDSFLFVSRRTKLNQLRIFFFFSDN